MAPKGVTNIPIIMWLGKHMISSQKIDMSAFNKHRDKSISHDNLSHTLMGMFEIKTSVYKKELDLHLLGIN
jgi:lipid A ethanolaminephosphotransferase